LTLQSMTGFARREDQFEDVSWVWEFRSVNGKGLDVRLRMPPGFEPLEAQVRKTCQQKLSRGNIQLNLSVSRGDSVYVPSVNEPMLDAVLSAISKIESKAELRASSAVEILGVRGVLDMSDEPDDEKHTENMHKEVLASLGEALSALVDHRGSEGAALYSILSGHLDELERLAEVVENDPARSAEAIRERLEQQVSQLADANVDLNKDRLHQEVALIATKADIREELDRLEAHIAAARGLLKQGSPVGRKLEFLAQEFNRETNTLCSKSNAVSITESGLAMKVIVDQFREQILNVE